MKYNLRGQVGPFFLSLSLSAAASSAPSKPSLHPFALIFCSHLAALSVYNRQVDAGTVCSAVARQVGTDPTAFCLLAGWFGATLSMQLTCPIDYEPSSWAIHKYLLPWLPSVAVVMILFSLGGLDVSAYKEIGWFVLGLVIIYAFFSMPLSYIRHHNLDEESSESLRWVQCTAMWLQLRCAAAEGAFLAHRCRRRRLFPPRQLYPLTFFSRARSDAESSS